MLDIEYVNAGGAGIHSEFWGFAGRAPDDAENEPFMKWLYTLGNTSDAAAPKVFSTSYGEDEDSTSWEYANRMNAEFMKAGARGISLLYASGDEGANCERLARFRARVAVVLAVRHRGRRHDVRGGRRGDRGEPLVGRLLGALGDARVAARRGRRVRRRGRGRRRVPGRAAVQRDGARVPRRRRAGGGARRRRATGRRCRASRARRARRPRSRASSRCSSTAASPRARARSASSTHCCTPTR